MRIGDNLQGFRDWPSPRLLAPLDLHLVPRSSVLACRRLTNKRLLRFRETGQELAADQAKIFRRATDSQENALGRPLKDLAAATAKMR